MLHLLAALLLTVGYYVLCCWTCRFYPYIYVLWLNLTNNRCSFQRLPTFVILVAVRKWRELMWGYCKNNRKLTGKVVIITGANSGIGFEVAKELAKREAKVILACRDLKKANDAIAKILSTVPSSKQSSVTLIPMYLDLTSLKSVKSFVEEFNSVYTGLDILINNAGVAYPKDVVKMTEDGYEIQFGVNHLAHFLLTNLLLPNLKIASPSKVIVVSSKMYEKGNIYLKDLNLKERSNRSGQYANSKLANVYFTRELAEKVKSFDINVSAVSPGLVFTNLHHNFNFKWYHYVLAFPILFFYMRTPRQGAQTIIHCATENLDETGCFYANCEKYKSFVNFEPSISQDLWIESEKMVKKFL